MIKRWLRTHVTIVFVLATLLGVLHHHDDMEVHEDCQICTIQSNITDGDISRENPSHISLKLASDAGIAYEELFHTCTIFASLHARAPPKYS